MLLIEKDITITTNNSIDWTSPFSLHFSKINASHGTDADFTEDTTRTVKMKSKRLLVVTCVLTGALTKNAKLFAE